jgi:hypothetical protein
VGTAEECSLGLDPVPYDLAAAVLAHRSEPVNGTFEAVESMGITGGNHLEGQVIVVAADFTSSHRNLLFNHDFNCFPPIDIVDIQVERKPAEPGT